MLKKFERTLNMERLTKDVTIKVNGYNVDFKSGDVPIVGPVTKYNNKWQTYITKEGQDRYQYLAAPTENRITLVKNKLENILSNESKTTYIEYNE